MKNQLILRAILTLIMLGSGFFLYQSWVERSVSSEKKNKPEVVEHWILGEDTLSDTSHGAQAYPFRSDANFLLLGNDSLYVLKDSAGTQTLTGAKKKGGKKLSFFKKTWPPQIASLEKPTEKETGTFWFLAATTILTSSDSFSLRLKKYKNLYLRFLPRTVLIETLNPFLK